MGIEVNLVELPEFLAAGERDGGQAGRKEKRAASTRLRPRKSAAVSVEPERDTPGTKAPTCAIPTVSASESVVSSNVRIWRAIISANASSSAMASEDAPIT